MEQSRKRNFFMNLFYKNDKRSNVRELLKRHRFTIFSVLEDPIDNRLYFKYLQKINEDTNARSLVYYRNYELCDKVIKNRELLRDKEIYKQLYNLYPFPFYGDYREELKKIYELYVKDKNSERVLQLLERVKHIYMENLERCIDSIAFRKDLTFKTKLIKTLAEEIYDEIYMN